MTFVAGDRVRWECTGDDGLPLVRYGFVGGQVTDSSPVVVMLDGEITAMVVPCQALRVVTITNLELHFSGTDLIDDPGLRHGLLALWEAEADSAGLAVEDVRRIDCCECGDSAWPLAELTSCGDRYVVRARPLPGVADSVCVRAERAAR